MPRRAVSVSKVFIVYEGGFFLYEIIIQDIKIISENRYFYLFTF